MHCCFLLQVLAEDAIKAALKDYKIKQQKTSEWQAKPVQ